MQQVHFPKGLRVSQLNRIAPFDEKIELIKMTAPEDLALTVRQRPQVIGAWNSFASSLKSDTTPAML